MNKRIPALIIDRRTGLFVLGFPSGIAPDFFIYSIINSTFEKNFLVTDGDIAMMERSHSVTGNITQS